MTASILLASQSPRRRELLAQIGVSFERIDVVVDEHWDARELAAEHVTRLAVAKAWAGWSARPQDDPRSVLAADTVVVVDEDVLGKPRDRADGLRMLARLSGRSHFVYSAVALRTDRGTHSLLSTTQVRFKTLTEREREAYWASGEPVDKAGSYAIQGLGAAFVAALDGSYSGVMGLPLFETVELLNDAGIAVL